MNIVPLDFAADLEAERTAGRVRLKTNVVYCGAKIGLFTTRKKPPH